MANCKDDDCFSSEVQHVRPDEPSVDWSVLSPEVLLHIFKANTLPEAEYGKDDHEAVAGFAEGSAKVVDVDAFMRLLRVGVACIDVRPASEFDKGHVTGAICQPLFCDKDQKELKTVFKQSGRKQALELVMEHVLPKLEDWTAKTCELMKSYPNSKKQVLVQDFRGSMRSLTVAWLLRRQVGLEAIVLRGGYNSFLGWARNLYCFLEETDCHTSVITQERENGNSMAKSCGTAIRKVEKGGEDVEFAASAEELEWRRNHPRRPQIVIVGGRTGCGKTRVLHELRDSFGQQVLDLEGLANHCGSAFGWCGHKEQPTTEQFENDVACQWSAFDPDRWVFVEDEASNVGGVSVPIGLYKCMREAPLILELKVSMEARVHVLVEDYASEKVRGQTPDWEQRMLQSTRVLKKRIGEERQQKLETLIKAGLYAEFSRVLLEYYDALYDKHIANAGGTGGGEGVRKGKILEVHASDDGQRLNANCVARRALQACNAITGA